MDLFLLGQWGVMLGMSLYVLIKGADVFLDGAKQVGQALGMSAFAIGILIVGFGTRYLNWRHQSQRYSRELLS